MTPSTKTETALERQVREEQEQHEQTLAAMSDADTDPGVLANDLVDAVPDGTASGNDPDKGKLFEIPRIAVLIDETDPGVIKLAFSGSIELDRTKADDVSFYNQLAAGKNIDLEVQAFVKGPQNTHRRDSDGLVDAVVQTKSLVVHSIETA
jgi:hypothetical protein